MNSSVVRHPVKAATLLITAALAAAALASCSSESGSEGQPKAKETSSVSADAQVAALIPDAIKKRGYITIATTKTSPPANYADADGKLVGYTLELGQAIAKTAGVEAKFQAVTFDDLIPGLTNGRYDAGMGNIWMTDERKQIVNFAPYGQITNAIMVPKSASRKPQGVEDLCGLKVALIKGAAQIEDVKAQAKTCVAEGKETITTPFYPDTTSMLLAVQNGRADATVYDAPILTYTARKMPNLQVTAEYGAITVGVALPENSGLGDALSAAVNKLIENGEYEAILKRWSIPTYAIDSSEYVK